MKRSLVWLALTGVLAGTATAQSPGVVEVGGFGRFTKFDNNLGLENGFGGGARLGVFFVKDVAVEVSQYYTKSDLKANAAQNASNYPIKASIVGGIPIGSGYDRILVGGGYVHNYYRSRNSSVGGEDDGFTGLLGLRKNFGPLVSLRLEGTVDFIPEPFNESATITRTLNYGAQAGLSVLIGNEGKVKDSDGDGVLDPADACPGTPKGEAVDAKGCPLPKDGDNDGVMDDKDACPNTPAGDAVDARGCSLPKDGDKDGVTDDKDACPNTPAGDKVDAKGCSLPKDSDGDGVMDDKDKCPATPKGDAVDANGCSLPKDADNDGVTDDKDRCPNTPAGTKVDAMGCRILFEEGKKALVLEGVNFATGKADLTEDSKAILDNVASSLKANPDVKVEVSGHTDITGSRALNRRLSAARATTVKDYLEAQGVDAGQITGAKGFGPDRPIASNKTAEGKAQNRRVELNRVN